MKNAGPVSMSTISPQLDGQYGLHTTQCGNASMLVAPAVSCWEAWRWELTRAAVRRNSTSVHRSEPSSCSGMTEVSLLSDRRRQSHEATRLPVAAAMLDTRLQKWPCEPSFPLEPA